MSACSTTKVSNQYRVEMLNPLSFPFLQLKRRLRKEISDKDIEIKDLQDRVNDLVSAKKHLGEKLEYVQSQYNNAVATSTELSIKFDELSEMSEKQAQHIKGLEITIKDYHKYFNETTGPRGNGSLDTSSENLDDSYALAIASLPREFCLIRKFLVVAT